MECRRRRRLGHTKMNSANLQRSYRTAKFYLVLGLTLVASTTAARAVNAPRPLAADASAKTLVYYNRPANGVGDFHYEFQTSNGITSKGRGNRHGHSGVSQYVSLEGIPVTLTYVADADGYHPMGAHIPKTPEQVLQSLSGRNGQPQRWDGDDDAFSVVRNGKLLP